MLGRLIDQILPHANFDPEHVSWANQFKRQVHDLSSADHEQAFRYIWGNTLPLFHSSHFNLINLETSVTSYEEKWPQKAFNYRASPANALAALRLARVDYCSLANNHTLDFREQGLHDTIQTLRDAGIAYAGCGSNLAECMRPAILEKHGKRIACFSAADHPSMWAASDDPPRAGIHYIDVEKLRFDQPDSDPVLIRIAKQLASVVRASASSSSQERARESDPKDAVDLIVYSLHWGSNYEWHPPKAFQRFAHFVIDHGVDLIHGHSSHHVQGIEIYKGKPVLYGCGDFLDDYAVHEDYRNDLGFAYQLSLDPSTNRWLDLRLFPTAIHRFCVNRLAAGHQEAKWLTKTMTKLCASFHTRLTANGDGTLSHDLSNS